MHRPRLTPRLDIEKLQGRRAHGLNGSPRRWQQKGNGVPETIFEYRRSAVSGLRRLVHDPVGMKHADGPSRLWADLQRVEYARTAMHDSIEITLTLAFETDGETFKFYSPRIGSDRLHADVAALLSDVRSASPDVPVLLGYSGGVRRTLFLIGVLCAVIGVLSLGLAVYLAIDGAYFDEVAGFVLGALLIGGLGGFYAWSNAPSRPQPVSTVQELITRIEHDG